jgi:hypothetical protein
MHIYEEAIDGDAGDPIGITAEIKDGGGKSLTTKTVDLGDSGLTWGQTVTISKTDSKLPYDVILTLSTKVSKKKRTENEEVNLKRCEARQVSRELTAAKRACGGPVTGRPNLGFESRIIQISAGPNQFDTTTIDQSAIPHMNVGGWDNSASPPVSLYSPWSRWNTNLYAQNRNMDAYWTC